MQYNVPVQSYDGTLAASSTTPLLFDLEQGHCVKALIIKLGGTFVAADIAELSCKLGGKDLLPAGITGADWQDMMDVLGYVADASFIIIPFTDMLSEPFFPAQARVGEIDTRRPGVGNAQKYSSFQLKVVPDGTQSASPTIEVQMICETEDKPLLKLPGLDSDFYDTTEMVRAWTYADVALSSANAYNKVAMDFGADFRNNLARTYIYAGNLTKLRARLNNRDLLPDQLATYISFKNKTACRRTPQSGQLLVDWTQGGNNFLALDTTDGQDAAGNFKVDAYVTGAETARVINEVVCPWARR